MADISGTSTAYLFYAAQSTYRSSAAGVSSVGVQPQSSELSSSQYVTHRTTISSAQAGGMLSTAIYIAKSITGFLDSLSENVTLAGSSLTQEAANVMVGGVTRLSVGNIQTGVNLILDGIDRLVNDAAIGSANILSSRSNDITIQTTAYGGKVNVSPQPFDVAGLGLQNLDLYSREGRTDALARLGRAKLIAEKQVLNLTALQKGLGDPSSLSSTLGFIGSTAGNLRGVLVNLTG